MNHEYPPEGSALNPQDVAFLSSLNAEMDNAYMPLEQAEQDLQNASSAQAAAAEVVDIAMLRIKADPQDSVAEARDILRETAAKAGHISNDEATLEYYSDPRFNPQDSPNAFSAERRRAAQAAVREMIEKGTLRPGTDELE